jgi:Kef-type K+ transport system membrane component KefB
MFAVGYEIDRRSLSARGRAALLIAIAALLVPMSLGSGVALLFRSSFTALGQPHTGRSFVLYIGVAMSITAVPVLAAIARERGIAGTTAGMTATAAAGIMDVAAWLVLAAVVTSAHKGLPWLVRFLLFGCFVAVMLLVVRPVLRRWISRPGFMLSSKLPLALALALGSGWVTASLGLQPVFGGFLAGLTMPSPDEAPDADILRPMEEIGGLLLPLFFVVTGLSVNIGALDGRGFALLAIICLIASGGKLGPAYLASRIGRLKPKDSATVAMLINTRGLTELIALNVGLSAGLIDQRLFSVFVLMALITTAATAPLLSLARVPPAPAAVSAPGRRPQHASSDPPADGSGASAPQDDRMGSG